MTSPKRAILVIDTDPVRYRAGFAGEKTYYSLICQKGDGTVFEERFGPRDDKTAFKLKAEWLETQYVADPAFLVLEEDKTVVAEPLEHVLQMVRAQLDSIVAEVLKFHKIDRRDLNVQLVMSGPGNFREKLATLKPYKGNRDPEHKPKHYKAIGHFLVARRGAYVTRGHEADDEIAIRAAETDERLIVATIDKDLDQIPGWHYDYMKKVHYAVSPEEANDWFWRQVLSGDPTDNIGGACGVGPQSADSYISDWYGLSDAQRWERVVEVYANAARKPRCYYAGQDPADVALENARLVYLQRRPGELWVPPGMKPESLPAEKHNVDE